MIAVALMYLAGKLSKFEVVDWIGRTSKHLRWWDMFVEDVTMDLLEGKRSVIDLIETSIETLNQTINVYFIFVQVYKSFKSKFNLNLNWMVNLTVFHWRHELCYNIFWHLL